MCDQLNVLYIHYRLKLHLAKVFFLFVYCSVFDHSVRLSELKSTLNADWFAASECTAVPLYF